MALGSNGPMSELKTRRFWVALIAELLGTMFLVLVACGSCARFKKESLVALPGVGVTTTAPILQTIAPATSDKKQSALDKSSLIVHYDFPTDIVQISLAFGLSVGTIVWAIAHVSGGHINPAVTFGFLVTRKISLVRALLYILVQCLGAIIGAALLKVVSPSGSNDDLGNSSPGAGVSLFQTFLVEMFITFVLVWTVFATCDGQRTDLAGSGPLAIGLSIAMCHLWAVPYTGSGMNPARVLGAALVSGKLYPGLHWVYWLGPLIGGGSAALLYDHVFAVNASAVKLLGFFSRHYDDSQFDRTGRKDSVGDQPINTELSFKNRA